MWRANQLFIWEGILVLLFFCWRCYFLVLAVLFFMFDVCVGCLLYVYIADVYAEFVLA